MSIGARLVRDERGRYGGPMGWIDSQDNADFAVAVRSGVIASNLPEIGPALRTTRVR